MTDELSAPTGHSQPDYPAQRVWVKAEPASSDGLPVERAGATSSAALRPLEFLGARLPLRRDSSGRTS
jgi:hypothetical protein